MPLVTLESKPHKLLRKLVYDLRSKRGLNRDPSNTDIIQEGLQLLVKKEKIK